MDIEIPADEDSYCFSASFDQHSKYGTVVGDVFCNGSSCRWTMTEAYWSEDEITAYPNSTHVFVQCIVGHSIVGHKRHHELMSAEDGFAVIGTSGSDLTCEYGNNYSVLVRKSKVKTRGRYNLMMSSSNLGQPGTLFPVLIVIKVGLVSVHSSDTDSYYLEETNDVDHIGTVKGTGNVVLKATITPDTAETRAVIDWQGATEDASDPLKATLSRTTSAKTEVNVLVNGSACREANVWVIWTGFTSFNNTGSTPTDSGVSPDGTYGVAYGASAGTKNGMLLQSTISPAGFNAVGNVSYDIKRTKERATWSKSGATWTQDTHVGPGADDDGHDGDEDLTASSDDHIYVTDTPGFNSATSFADEAVYKASFVEFVNIKFGSSSWIKCSGDYDWHSITWLEDNGSGHWQRKTSESNEIDTGSTTVGTSSTP